MPITFIEEAGSQSIKVAPDGGDETLIFKIYGTDVRDEAMLATELNLPGFIVISSTLFGGVGGTLTYLCQGYELEHRGTLTWQGRATYGRRQPRLTGDVVAAFDCTGGTAHITTSLETAHTYKATGETASIPDFKNAVNVDGDNVNGTDIVVPVFKLTLDCYPPVSFMTPTNINAMRVLIGTTNDKKWAWFDKGVLLYMGWTGQPRSYDDWAISHHFIGADDVAGDPGLTIGAITGIAKASHDFVWIRYKQGTSSNFGVKTPQFAYVERVYDPADFAALQLEGIPWIGVNGNVWAP